MKVSLTTIRKLVREAVEECYGEGMKEQSWQPRSAVPAPVRQADTQQARYSASSTGTPRFYGRMDFTPAQAANAGTAPATPAAAKPESAEALEEQQGSWAPRTTTAAAAAAAPTADAVFHTTRQGAAAPQMRRAAGTPADMTITPGEAASSPSVAAPSATTKESLNRLIKTLVSEALKEQAYGSWAPDARRFAPRDTYMGGGAAPTEGEARRAATAAGLETSAGRMTPEQIRQRAANVRALTSKMVDTYRRTGRMPSDSQLAALGLPGVEGMNAVDYNMAARRAGMIVRGLNPESGADRMARRTGAGDVAPMSDTDFNAMIGSLAAGAPRVGSALRPSAAPSSTPAERRDAEMRALAAQRRLDAEARRGGGAPAAVATPANLGLASAGGTPPLPPAGSPATSRRRGTTVASLDDLTSTPSGDPIEGLTEMVRKAIKKALTEKQNKK